MGDGLFAGSCSGVFYAFDRASGDLRWVYDTRADGRRANFHGEPVVTNDLIVVGSDVAGIDDNGEPSPADGHVYAFELTGGAVRWKYGLDGGIPSDLVRHTDAIYGVTQDGVLHCIELASGKPRWQVDPDTPSMGRSLSYAPVLFEGTVVFSAPDGAIVAVEASSGKIVWRRRLHEEINTTLVLAGRHLFAGTEHDTMYGIDAGSGEISIRFPTPARPYGTPVVLEDSLLLLLEGGNFARVAFKDGAVRWTRSAEDEWSSFRPLRVGDRVLVGNAEGELSALDVDSGRSLETYRVEGAIRGFTVVDGILYIGTLPGRLYAYRM